MRHLIVISVFERFEQLLVPFNVLATVCFYPCVNRTFRSLMSESLGQSRELLVLDVLHNQEHIIVRRHCARSSSIT